MKKFVALVALLVVFIVSCSKDKTDTTFEVNQTGDAVSDLRNCASHEVIEAQNAADATIAARRA